MALLLITAYCSKIMTPYAISAMPAIREITFAEKNFSIRTNRLIMAIQSIFIMPETKRSNIKIQQHPGGS
jgi:hypothetical protein